MPGSRAFRASNQEHSCERLLDRGARAGSLAEIPFRARHESFSLGIEARLPDEIAKRLVEAAPVQYESELEFPAGRWFLDLLLDGMLFFEEYIPLADRIAWGAHVWLVNRPDRLIHYNSDRFLPLFGGDG